MRPTCRKHSKMLSRESSTKTTLKFDLSDPSSWNKNETRSLAYLSALARTRIEQRLTRSRRSEIVSEYLNPKRPPTLETLMLRTSFDKWFWHDGSPEWHEYLNTPWSVQYAPITEAVQEAINSFRTQLISPSLSIPPIPTIFTDDSRQIEGVSGASTHDNQGRPRLDSSGGVPRAVAPFSRCPHGRVTARCRRCRR